MTIAIALQATLQVAIAHHGIMPNNPNLVPTLINLSPQQLIVVTTNIFPTIDETTLLILWGNSFEFLS
jgi:hypothetical protein